MHLLGVVLGDLISDKENEVQIDKFHLGWKLDSKIFPTSYHMPNLDTEKASKSFLQNALCSALLTRGALPIQEVRYPLKVRYPHNTNSQC